ncbi:MAG: hypothetical protein RR351_06110, partial [Christensenella sp.]
LLHKQHGYHKGYQSCCANIRTIIIEVAKLKKYDVAIIGGGISGIMCAYRLTETNPALSVVLL